MARPNVLVVTWHDLGDWLGCYGRDVESPNVDAFAEEGVLLENYFATAPNCCPSRASMMTGRLPHLCGVYGQTNRGWDMDRDVRTFPQCFRDAGYDTHLYGVGHESTDPEWEGYDRHHDSGERDPVEVAREVFDRDDEDDPFYLNVGTHAVHRPFPAEYDESIAESIDIPPYLPDTGEVRVDLARFHEYIRRTDEGFGELLSALDDGAQREETLVVFTTDHGAPIPRGKKTLYDPGIKIACAMRWPGVIEPGTEDALLSNVDFMPTVLDLLGIEGDRGTLEGRSFAELIDRRADAAEYDPREAVYAENTYAVTYDPLRCIRTGDHKLILNFDHGSPIVMEPHPVEQYGAETIDGWFSAPIPEEQLFDLVADPWELGNRAPDPRKDDVRRDLRRRLIARFRETDDRILDGPIPDPVSPEDPRDTFETMWDRDGDGLYHVSLPEQWQDVEVGFTDS